MHGRNQVRPSHDFTKKHNSDTRLTGTSRAPPMAMSRMVRHFAIGVLLLAGVFSAWPAAAQAPGKVRVVHGPVRIQSWYRTPERETLFEAPAGTILEVLAQENDWYWVIVPPDAHGTRRAGWVRAGHVEAVTPTSSGSAREQQETNDRTAATPSAGETLVPAAADHDTVVITERGTANGTGKRVSTFEDVHFDRNRYSLRPEDMTALGGAITALQADPSLVVNIQGHTCSLGSEAYNLALGLRRATAVKDYLVSQGISADRLHLISLGEGDAKHDNSAEQTRHLNRRVALVAQ
jgi:outer membrane protein OmpA-like peptidoglycan-associated protein